MSAAASLGELRRACDGHVEPATQADSVLGVQPDLVVRPGSSDEVGEVLKVADAHDLAVVVRGTGSRLAWGAAPSRYDVVLDTTRLDRLVEHAEGDLIVVTGAGRLVSDLQEDLAGAGQRLGLDAPRSGTVGGAVATGSSGPLRLRHGAVRDLVIGMTLVRADGVVAHSGGKVVKNVAGYDLGKLMTGSFGTLAVITQVAFRLHPVPVARHWVTRTVSSSDDAHEAVQALVHSQLAPCAVELDWLVGLGDAQRAAPRGAGTVAAMFEGHQDGALDCAHHAVALLGGDAIVRDDAPPWWGREPAGDPASDGPPRHTGRDSAGMTLCTITHEVGRLAALLDALADVVGDGVGDGVGAVALRGSAGVGTVQMVLGGGSADTIDAVESLRAASSRFGGFVVVREAPAAVRAGLDVWGPVRGLGLMRAVKSQFDPAGRLAPGRFVGGI